MSAAKKQSSGKSAPASESRSQGVANTGQPRPVMTSLELRRLAEHADGFRDERLDLMWGDPGSGKNEYHVKHAGSSTSGGDALFPMFTPYENTIRRGKRPKVTIQIGSADPIQAEKEYDAIFWGEAAVEKFVFGYYLRMLPWDAFQFFHDAYLKPDRDVPLIIAVAHRPASDYGMLSEETSLDLITSEGVMSFQEYYRRFFR